MTELLFWREIGRRDEEEPPCTSTCHGSFIGDVRKSGLRMHGGTAINAQEANGEGDCVLLDLQLPSSDAGTER